MKRKYIIISTILAIIISLFVVGNYEWKSINSKENKVDINVDTSLDIPKNQLEYLQTLIGVKSKDMEILQNPLRIEGNFYIPEETVLSIIENYLNKTNNSDIENVEITINKKGITIGGEYKLLANLKTPIDIDILPTLTESNDLRLNLKDIRLLNLSLSDNIVDAIVESWFSDLENITVDQGDVIINKDFFKNMDIKSINVEEDYLVIDLSIKLK